MGHVIAVRQLCQLFELRRYHKAIRGNRSVWLNSWTVVSRRKYNMRQRERLETCAKYQDWKMCLDLQCKESKRLAFWANLGAHTEV
jgi:hypothetical protein